MRLQQKASNQAPKLLDSIFAPDGPMPATRFSIRVYAFLLDFILITAFWMLALNNFLLPNFHPETFEAFQIWLQKVADYSQADSLAPLPEMSPALQSGLNFALEMQILFFWCYFAANETFFSGLSLGKKIFSIRSIHTVTLEPPTVISGITRASLKTLAVTFLFPLFLCISVACMLFNKRKQTGHDLISQTTVIDSF
jgi:uncharacterized RDD family membrane protein YckC